MSGQPFQLDPEVEHVLQEVARDPNSALLRVERPTVLRGLLETEPRVGVATAGLTTAERHLVQTRRAETALALRALCLRELILDTRGENIFSREGTIEVASLDDLLAAFRVRWLADRDAHVSSIGGAHDIVTTACIERPSPGVHFLAMSAASMRLDPAAVAQVYSAQWLILNQQYRSAINLLQSTLDRAAHARSLSITFANLALACNFAGWFERSLKWYQRASQAMRTNTASTCGQFVVAAQIGDERDFLRAAALIDHSDPAQASEFQWQCRAQLARRQQFLQTLRPAGRELLLRSKDRLGPVSRRLADALI